jgi:hypothetical protein
MIVCAVLAQSVERLPSPDLGQLESPYREIKRGSGIAEWRYK